jgi:hypothetical protein
VDCTGCTWCVFKKYRTLIFPAKTNQAREVYKCIFVSTDVVIDKSQTLFNRKADFACNRTAGLLTPKPGFSLRPVSVRFVVDIYHCDGGRGRGGLPLDFLTLLLFSPALFITGAISRQMTALLISFVPSFCSVP